MRNTSIKIDYFVGLIADAVRDYSIRENDEIFQSIIIELKKHFENCSEEEIMDILSLCVKMYSLEHSESAELVITSPDSFKVKSRKTKDVIYSLVKEATRSITITGYSISDFFTEMLERLRPDLFIERFVGEVPPRFVNETPWGLIRNVELLRLLENRLQERDTWQGRLLEK